MDDTSEQVDEQPAPEPAKQHDGPLHIVAIAASAGGLEAVSIMAQNLPQDAHATYVIAQHMSPTHKSVLSALISRETQLPVVELGPEVTPEADTIYVTPPNTDVVLERGMLRLRNPSGHPASPKPSADRLFKSLAEEVGESCVGIVLSGTGSDGSYGVQSIREVGGITIAQDPGTAKYDGMPTSAIETGCIDLTLSPEQIGQHLERILARPRDLDALRPLVDQPNKLSELFGILLARTQVDFADYKENTLNRRISRRMTALNIEEYDDYVDYCRTNADEVDALHKDLLISVTRFFRDPDQFDRLRNELASILESKVDRSVRVWVVGSATGEEAYSVAILITEILGGLASLNSHRVQVFATDIDTNAIEVARRGTYPISAAQDIPEDYLNTYFVVGENEITVRPEIRATTLFSRHNVFQDSPFINIDLVSIRNVLIYFNQSLQERVLSRLHYSMAANGLLFVGTSETVGEMRIYFESRRGSDKIFGKRRGISGEVTTDPSTRMFHRGRNSVARASGNDSETELASQAEMSIARAVAPNGMICSREGNIVEVIGQLTPFIEIRSGISTSLNINMLIEPLRSEATSLIAVALRSKERRDGRWHHVSLPTGNRVQLQVFPFASHRGGEVQCLVAVNTKFEDQSSLNLQDISDEDQRAYVERIETDMRATQEALQQTIEELQTANEELQSSNEEHQSTSEEFQATNEELETSNEELQSTNEELLTVNEELQISSAERQALASELEATLLSAPYVIALADQALMMRRVSSAALSLFGLNDVPPTGVHLSQCFLPEGFPALAPMANTVMRVQETRRAPVLSEGKNYDLVISPVRDVHDKLIGVSITVTQYETEPFAKIVEMMSDAFQAAYWSYNVETEQVFWSPELHTLLGFDPGMAPPDLRGMIALAYPSERAELETSVSRLLETGGSYEAKHRFIDANRKIRAVNARIVAVLDDTENSVQLIGFVQDLSDSVAKEILQDNFEDSQADIGVGLFSYDVENCVSTWNRAMFDLTGQERNTFEPPMDYGVSLFHQDDREHVQTLVSKALDDGSPYTFTANVLRPDHSLVACEGRLSVRRSSDNLVTHVFGSLRALERK